MQDNELDRSDALALAALIRKGAISSGELLEHVIARIEQRDVAINAIPLRHFEEARARVLAPLDPQAPFAGVPFLLKDLWCDLAGTVTTNGSRLFAGQRATLDSEIVRRFKRAGLVIVGKTSSPEFGLSPSSESTLHGATRNPWNGARIAGGSSGGAAAAVAARIVPMAHATDGGGSIRIPAACCGVFGMKPTRARTPLGPGKLEGWGGLSHAHAVSISVRDNAALLDAIAGAELGAPYAAPRHGSFLAATERRTRGLRIALMRTPLTNSPVDPACLVAVDGAAQLCRSLGHIVEEARPQIDGSALVGAFGAIVTVATRQTLEDRATALGRPWTREDVEPVTATLAAYGGQIDGLAHARARESCLRAGRAMAEFMEHWDVILSPTLAQPPVPLGTVAATTTDFAEYSRTTSLFSPFTSTANITGQPAMSVPLHWSADGLPIGVMFAGRFGEEELLYGLAAQLEEAAPWRDRVPGGC